MLHRAGFDLLHRDRVAGEARIEHFAAVILQRRARGFIPQRLATLAARARLGAIGEWIDPGLVDERVEMQMREFGVAGQSDMAERRAGLDALAARDADAALGHMAVLRHPAVGVADHDAVTAFATLYGFDNGFAN